MTPNPSPTDDLELDDILFKLVNFATYESADNSNGLEYRISDAKAALTAREARKAEEAKQSTARIYEKELRYLRAFQQSVVDREALKTSNELYICDNMACSQFHTKDDLVQLQHQTKNEGE